MKYAVFISESFLYKYDVEGASKEEAAHLAQTFFSLESERPDHLVEKTSCVWNVIENPEEKEDL